MGAKVDIMSGGSAEVSINTGAAVMAAKVVDVVVDKASGLNSAGSTRALGSSAGTAPPVMLGT
jgi:hypothetical protein